MLLMDGARDSILRFVEESQLCFTHDLRQVIDSRSPLVPASWSGCAG